MLGYALSVEHGLVWQGVWKWQLLDEIVIVVELWQFWLNCWLGILQEVAS